MKNLKQEFKDGDKVRVLECRLGNPKHIGQIGVFLTYYADGSYCVDLGSNELCDALKIEEAPVGRPKGSKNKYTNIRRLAREYVEEQSEKSKPQIKKTVEIPVCTQTTSGKHIFNLSFGRRTEYPECKACGLVNDLEDNG